MSTITIDPEHDTDPDLPNDTDPELPSYITHDIHEVNLHNPLPDPSNEDTLISYNLDPEPKKKDFFIPTLIFTIIIVAYIVVIIAIG